MNTQLMTAILRLPQDYYVQFSKEQNEEDEWFLTACILQKPPEDGWSSRGACFGHPPDWSSHQEPCPRHSINKDTARFGVSASIDEPEVLERWLIAEILREWP